MNNIRNFVITAHIDAGKSTLADRMLELTGTVEKRKMRAQYLDQLDLERERGITIKMAPVRMSYTPSVAGHGKIDGGGGYILNLIDTPGHSDFSYEVSRALAAVEGAVLLIDVTKGIQAQTLSNFRAAKKAGLTIIGAVNKIDVDGFDVDEAVLSVADLIGCSPDEVHRISAKTGDGVEKLLQAIITRVPSPKIVAENESRPVSARALVFDSLYDDHKGIIAYVRVFGGSFGNKEEVKFFATEAKCKPKEIGYFSPAYVPSNILKDGEIGYIATGLKELAAVKIGDTIIKASRVAGREPKEKPLFGYKEPQPVVFISFYPDGNTKFDDLKRALDRLHLTDAALNIEPDANEALGRGLKVGFLGQLHVEIIASRLEREFGVTFLTSFPSIAYRVKEGGSERIIKEPHAFPVNPEAVWEPIIHMEVVAPSLYIQSVLALQRTFSFEVEHIETLRGDIAVAHLSMPLAELIRD